LTSPAMEMLADIRKNTVDFSDNFDASLQEPDVLPSALPNLLVNGATGIAVGMSTNIPPHNLGEVVDALVFMLGNWERLDDVNIEDLMKFIQGPDFPTGGLIVQDTHEDDLNAAYGTGRGRVTVQARCHIEEITRGRNRIIVTELPYMTNKSSLIEHIAQLAREGNLEGIADLRDESDRHGLRIVIELTRTAEPEKVLQDLYRRTAMRSTFGIILLALVDGEPRMLSLKQALRVYLDHRLAVIRRRAEFDLEKARARLHILEGLRVALRHLDEIIDLIKKAPDADIARDRLMKRYRLSEIQAQAILDMQLRRLAALERKKIEDEYKELLVQIKQLEVLLKSPLKMRQLVAAELQQVKEAYGDRRRTQITRLGAGAKSVLPVLTATDLLPEQAVWISATSDGLISRALDDKPPRTSGTAAPRFLLRANTRDILFLVSERGEAAGIPVQTLPEAATPQEGAPVHKVSALTESDQLVALFTLPSKEERLEGWFVFTATQQGMLKKTAIEELPGPTGHSFTLVRVNEGDQLGWIRLTDGQAEVLLVTANGMAIRFHESEVRPMGLVAAGVSGIKLGERDLVIGMELIPRKGEILLLTSDGKAKRLPPEQFPRQGRYGQGVIAWKLPSTTQLVGIAAGKATTRLTVLIDKLSPKAMRMDEAPLQTRAASGKPAIDLKAGYALLGLNIPWVMPRPITGEKASSEEELESEETPDEPIEPAAQQLTFGVGEHPIPPTGNGNQPKTRPARQTTKPKSQTPRKPVKKPTAQQNSIESKPAPSTKKLTDAKAEKKEPTQRETKKKPVTNPSNPMSGKVKGKNSTSNNSTRKTTSKTEPSKPVPNTQVGKSTTKTTTTVGKSGSKSKPHQTTKKQLTAPGQPTKPEKNAGAKKSPSQPTNKPSGSAKSVDQKTDQVNKATAKPTLKTQNKSSAGRKQPKATTKPDSATANQTVLLPPGWKPITKKTPPSARIKKSTKPKQQ
jgi:DNA gyrase subunit A